MQRKSFGNMSCPIARSLERVGEWWSILILRDAFYGLTRFDEFQKSLSIAPNMLTRRLNALVEEGLLEKLQYCEKPPRFEYHLTDRGRDFRPVMLALMSWGNKHFAPEGKSVVLLDAESGDVVEPVLYDCEHHKPVTSETHFVGAGPMADESVHKRMERAAEFRAAQKAALAQ